MSNNNPALVCKLNFVLFKSTLGMEVEPTCLEARAGVKVQPEGTQSGLYVEDENIGPRDAKQAQSHTTR